MTLAKCRTADDVVRYDRMTGGHFFSERNVKAWRTRVLEPLCRGAAGQVVLVTSDAPPGSARKYTVRRLLTYEGGRLNVVTDNSYDTADKAKRRAAYLVSDAAALEAL